MKFAVFLLFFVFNFVSLIAQVPSGQVLYLSFDNTVNSEEGLNPIQTVGVTYTSDRFNNAGKAIKFNGCQNPSFIRFLNTERLQFTTSFSVSFWMKSDLSLGMDPSNGVCSTAGHHVIMAKGGDGFGTTPPGFYTKLAPTNAGVQHVFGTSPNSGNASVSTNVFGLDGWNFYTYVISASNFKLYLNGAKISDQSININYSEMNNNDLYLGILGPKSTPSLGISQWFPLNASMDDFRIFNRSLTDTEIASLFGGPNTSSEILYLSFDNSYQSETGLLPTQSPNVSFVNDRNNNPNRAIKFWGCQNPSFLRYPNSSNFQITNGFSVSFWMKMDLSIGMNPGDGSCGSVGHQVIMAKGGDGFGTAPPGFYTKMIPNGSNGTHIFGSSNNSGNINISSEVNSPSAWKFYTYVVSSNSYKLYINGSKQVEQSINFNFSEMNSQDLFLGVLGPKSSPALGITNWFPMNAAMDEFRMFNRLLTDSEISALYTDNTILQTPSVKKMELLFTKPFLGRTNISASIKKFDDGYIIHELSSSILITGGMSYGSAIYKYTLADTLGWSKIIGGVSQVSFLNSINSGQFFVLADNSIYLLSRSSRAELLSIQNLPGRVATLSDDELYIYILTTDYNYYARYHYFKFKKNGEQVAENIYDNISTFDYSSKGLVITSSVLNQTFIVNSNMGSRYFNFSGSMCKWVGDKVIISNSYGTYRIHENNLIEYVTSGDRIFFALNSGDYILYKEGSLLKYNSNHNLIFEKSIFGFKGVLPVSNNLVSYENSLLKVYNVSNGNLMYSIDIVLTMPEVDSNIFEFDNSGIYVVKNTESYWSVDGSKIYKFDNIGRVSWFKEFPRNARIGKLVKTSNSIAFVLQHLDSNSYYILDGYLCVLTSENNPCDYRVTSDISDFYCAGSYTIKGYLALPLNTLSTVAISATLSPPNDFTAFWSKNNVTLTGSNLNLTQSGLYKFTIRQGTCEQSISKYVTVAPALSNPTSITAAPSNICVGNNAILSGSCSAGSLKWYSDQWLVNEVSSTVRPSSTSNYYGVCIFNTCKSTSVQTNVVVSNTPPPAPSVFSNFTDFVCQSAGNRTYEIAPVSQAAGYEWSYTGNGVSVSSQGTRAVANFSSTASSGNIRVRSIGACGASNYLSMGVEVLPLSLRINDRRDYGAGSRNVYRVGKSIELLPSSTTAINISNGAVFKAEVIACPN